MSELPIPIVPVPSDDRHFSHRICVGFGDEAWQVYEQWAETVTDDPGVTAMFTPRAGTIGTIICPNVALAFPIMLEANSIIHHYAPLSVDQVFTAPLLPAVLPTIPGPLNGFPAMPIYVHHAKVALSGLIQRIQDPPANYPTIFGLGLGSYICHVHQQWANGVVVIAVFKP
jgi:hypothetical protein